MSQCHGAPHTWSGRGSRRLRNVEPTHNHPKQDYRTGLVFCFSHSPCCTSANKRCNVGGGQKVTIALSGAVLASQALFASARVVSIPPSPPLVLRAQISRLSPPESKSRRRCSSERRTTNGLPRSGRSQLFLQVPQSSGVRHFRPLSRGCPHQSPKGSSNYSSERRTTNDSRQNPQSRQSRASDTEN